MEGLPRPMKEVVVPLHISSGITILLLTVARVLGRLTHRPPPFSPHLAARERAAAHTVHALLYLLMIGMPLVGWSIISAHPPRARRRFGVRFACRPSHRSRIWTRPHKRQPTSSM
jgi:cytochrome b561